MIHLFQRIVKEVLMKKLIKVIGVFLIVAVVLTAVIVMVIVNKTVLIKHPELNGEPEIGKWYRVTPEGTKSPVSWKSIQAVMYPSERISICSCSAPTALARTFGTSSSTLS